MMILMIKIKPRKIQYTLKLHWAKWTQIHLMGLWREDMVYDIILNK